MNTVDVILDGTIIPGANPDKAAAALAQLAGITPEQARALLTSGQPKTVRRGTSPEAGETMVKRFTTQGIAASLRPCQTAATAQVAQEPPRQKAPTTAVPQPPPDEDDKETHATRMSIAKSAVWALIFGGLLAFLLLAPVHLTNRIMVPVWVAQNYAENYCEKTLKKATATYVLAKGMEKTVAMAQRIEMEAQVNLPMVGSTGLTFAPFELLTTVKDGLDEVSYWLFLVMTMTALGKLSIGLISFLCFKLCLPLILALGLAHVFSLGRLPWAKPAALFLAKTTLVAWLFFPTTALVNNYVDHGYLNFQYESRMQEADLIKAQVDEIGKALAEQSIEADESDDEADGKGLLARAKSVARSATDNMADVFGKIKNSFSMLGSKITALPHIVDEAIDKIRDILCVFLLTTFVIPLGMLYLLHKIMGALGGDYQATLIAFRRNRDESE